MLKKTFKNGYLEKKKLKFLVQIDLFIIL